MNTNLGQIFNDVLFRSGKDKRGGYITPVQFNMGIRVISERYANMLVDSFEKTKEVTSDLEPLIKTYGSAQFPPLTFTAVFPGDNTMGGYCDLPEDYWYHARSFYLKTENDGCTLIKNYTPVEFVSQHIADAKLASSIESPVINPTENYPLMFTQNELFYVYPYLQRISCTIIKQPPQPVFDYDNVSGMWVYLPPGTVHVNSSVLPAGTPSQSVEFTYQESSVDQITKMLVEYFAIGNEVRWNLEANPPVK